MGRCVKNPGQVVRKDAFKQYQKDALDAAKDLLYPPIVSDKLRKAKTSYEIARIMADARHGRY